MATRKSAGFSDQEDVRWVNAIDKLSEDQKNAVEEAMQFLGFTDDEGEKCKAALVKAINQFNYEKSSFQQTPNKESLKAHFKKIEKACATIFNELQFEGWTVNGRDTIEGSMHWNHGLEGSGMNTVMKEKLAYQFKKQLEGDNWNQLFEDGHYEDAIKITQENDESLKDRYTEAYLASTFNGLRRLKIAADNIKNKDFSVSRTPRPTPDSRLQEKLLIAYIDAYKGAPNILLKPALNHTPMKSDEAFAGTVWEFLKLFDFAETTKNIGDNWTKVKKTLGF